MTQAPHFHLRWARTGPHHAHSNTPHADDLHRDGWRIVGRDPRYPESVLMRKDGESTGSK